MPEVLLLDEMLSPAIAERLVVVGCGTRAISSGPALRGSSDAEVLEIATAEGRVLVTDNIRDFFTLSHTWTSQGRTHAGILLISSKPFPKTSTPIDGIAAALIRRHSANAWPSPGQCEFLTP